MAIKKYKTVCCVAVILLLLGACNKPAPEDVTQVTYPDNEDEEYEDMLTPGFYSSEVDDAFRTGVNKFVFFARQASFLHPLDGNTGQKTAYTTPAHGEFGAAKGAANAGEHHPAIDMYVGNNETDVSMYAAYSGTIATYRDADKYRQYLSLTTEIKDSTGTVIGKMVTLYAHIDLDLDEADGLQLNGTTVTQGDIVSKHLYSGTMGGPHLHFEIRYYRPADAATEEYYSFIKSSSFTQPSGGKWTMGYWNPNVGYGYGNPENYFSATQ